MGCNTCNGKKQGEMSYDDIPGKEIKLIPSAIADGNFNEMNIILKLVTTVVILMAIPLVLVAITIQFILHMFTPKWLQKIQTPNRSTLVGTQSDESPKNGASLA